MTLLEARGFTGQPRLAGTSGDRPLQPPARSRVSWSRLLRTPRNNWAMSSWVGIPLRMETPQPLRAACTSGKGKGDETSRKELFPNTPVPLVLQKPALQGETCLSRARSRLAGFKSNPFIYLSPAFKRKGKNGSRQAGGDAAPCTEPSQCRGCPGLSQRGTDCAARCTRRTEPSHSDDGRGIGAEEFCHRRVKAGGAAQLQQSPPSQAPCLGELPGQQSEGSPSAGSQGGSGVSAARRQRPLSGELQPQAPERDSFPTASAARRGSGCVLGARCARRQPKHAWSPPEKAGPGL